jgi:hypothetical protein
MLQVAGHPDNPAAMICLISKMGHLATLSISHMKREFQNIELMKSAVAHRARSVAM